MSFTSRYVVHSRKDPYDVFIGRPSKWGNPFVIGKDGDRNAVIWRYIAHLILHPELVEAARQELPGKVLGCFCAPAECHGDILAAIANDEHFYKTMLRPVMSNAEARRRAYGLAAHVRDPSRESGD